MLRIEGRVRRPLELTFAQLSAHEAGQIPDVRVIDASRRGSAIRLDSLLATCQSESDAAQLSIESADGFKAQVPLPAVADRAVLLYGLDGAPLPDALGGPLRFLVPDAAECHTAVVDTCKNVKNVVRLVLD